MGNFQPGNIILDPGQGGDKSTINYIWSHPTPYSASDISADT
jgi:hypothetical protein